jgi:hypothetical protein
MGLSLLPMSDSADNNAPSADTSLRRYVVLEIALVFAVFFLQGAWPVPDVNEPYYLGKAIHFWNPEWAAGDFFLETADSHQVFYFTFGWLALWLSPDVLAWTGRILTWGLMAWAWRRLSFAVVPRMWLSVLTAALFVCLQERCQMAGEWVVGGVEAKGFAYVLVFLGLEAMVRNRWNRAWLLLGAASAFHVLVGGWAVVAAGIAWLLLGKGRPRLLGMGPGLLGGLVLSLPGLLPSMALTWSAPSDVVAQANQVYVFDRLAHHLVPAYFPVACVWRFLAILVVLAVLDRFVMLDDARRRLRLFVAGTMVIATAGMAINFIELFDRPLAAGLLKFYWFRLSDVMVPLAVALWAGRFIVDAMPVRPRLARGVLAAALVVSAWHVGGLAVARSIPTVPRADRLHDYGAWRRACAWIAEPGNVPADARFLTPAMSQTFKWYAAHPEVVNWKEIPQDARSIVRWWRRMNEVYYTGNDEPGFLWAASLAQLDPARIRQAARQYDAQYVLTPRWPRRLDLPVVYWNERYVIYRVDGEEGREG